MDIIIDTNILYYWSQVTESDYSPEKIGAELRANGVPLISELSIMETLVHFRDNKEAVLKILKFIADEKIGILPYFKPEFSILTTDLMELLENDKTFGMIIENAFEKKVNFEADFLSFWLSCIISIVGVYLGIKNIFSDTSKSEKFFRQYSALVLSIRDHESFVIPFLKEVLTKFYNDEDEVTLKHSINETYMINVYVLLINYSCAKNNALFTQLSSESTDLGEAEIEKIMDDLHSDQLTKNLFKKLSEEDKEDTKRKGKELFHIKDSEMLKAINEFKFHLKKDLNNFMIEYFVDMFEKYLVLKDKKINKNDIIDSQIYINVKNGYEFITVDGDLLKIIKRIDEPRYNIISKTIEKMKK